MRQKNLRNFFEEELKKLIKFNFYSKNSNQFNNNKNLGLNVVKNQRKIKTKIKALFRRHTCKNKKYFK